LLVSVVRVQVITNDSDDVVSQELASVKGQEVHLAEEGLWVLDEEAEGLLAVLVVGDHQVGFFPVIETFIVLFLDVDRGVELVYDVHGD